MSALTWIVSLMGMAILALLVHLFAIPRLFGRPLPKGFHMTEEAPTYSRTPPVAMTASPADAEQSANDTIAQRELDTQLASVAAQYEKAAALPWKVCVPPELDSGDGTIDLNYRLKGALAASGPLHLWAFALGKLMENAIVVGTQRQTALSGSRTWVDVGQSALAVEDEEAARTLQQQMQKEFWAIVEPHRQRILKRIDVIAATLKRGEAVPVPAFIGVGTGQTFIVFEKGQEAERDALLKALNAAYVKAAAPAIETMLTELRGLVDEASAATRSA